MTGALAETSMSSGTQEVRAVFEGGWKIAVGGDRFGPYSTLDDAIFTARTWANNARKQGHQGAVSIDGPPFPD
jgi:hypothetical protein